MRSRVSYGVSDTVEEGVPSKAEGVAIEAPLTNAEKAGYLFLRRSFVI